ncbi:hypothetical protein LZ30DRAFT_787030 [Colletotrichum cereale]|nr:hypothetical protein LZ30DRAFT_787030 [Colletotrichum cereale]
MTQQAEPLRTHDTPAFGWHFGSTDAAQHFFCFPPPPPQFPPFFDNQQRGLAYRYESPPDVSEPTDFPPLDSLSSRCAEEESDYAQEAVLDLSTSEYPIPCEGDQFIVIARAERRQWREIQRDYEARFGASRSSTRQALAIKLSRLKENYPTLNEAIHRQAQYSFLPQYHGFKSA